MYKKIIGILICMLFIGMSVLPNVSSIKIEKNYQPSKIVKFQVYEYKNGNYEKIEKQMPIKKAFELKEKMDMIFKGQQSLNDKIKMQISLLKEYDLIPKDVSMEKTLENTKVRNSDISEIISKSKINYLIQKPIIPQNILNFIGRITINSNAGLTFAIGTHTLLPTFGIDLALLSIGRGSYDVKTTGLLGNQSCYRGNIGIVLGFAGFLILGFLGIYIPFVSAFGVYGLTLWMGTN